MVIEHRHLLDEFARTLLDNEVLDRGDIDRIMAAGPERSRPRVAASDPG
jgi:hypothetical protein